MPLSELEQLPILSTMSGVTGWHFAIMRHKKYAPYLSNYCNSPAGRTFPSVAGFITSEIFYTDGSTIDNLSTRLNRVEETAADEPDNFSQKIEYRYGLTEDEYEKLSPNEKHELRFNWYVKNIMPYYQAEVMSVHGLTYSILV
jgi:hypothetical protein